MSLVLNTNEGGKVVSQTNDLMNNFPNFTGDAVFVRMDQSLTNGGRSSLGGSGNCQINGINFDYICGRLREDLYNVGSVYGTEFAINSQESAGTKYIRIGTIGKFSGGEIVGQTIQTFYNWTGGRGGGRNGSMRTLGKIEIAIKLGHLDGTITEVGSQTLLDTTAQTGIVSIISKNDVFLETTNSGIVAQSGDVLLCDFTIITTVNVGDNYGNHQTQSVSFGYPGGAGQYGKGIQISVA